MCLARRKSGFTLVEVVLVLSILVIFFGLSALYYQTTQVRTDLNAQASNFVGFLRLAQSSAEAGKGDTSHGIHVENDRYVIFTGTTYNQSSPSNYEVILPDTIQISEYSLNGGSSDIVFNAPNGETDDYGTATFSSNRINQTKIVTITNAGAIIY